MQCYMYGVECRRRPGHTPKRIAPRQSYICANCQAPNQPQGAPCGNNAKLKTEGELWPHESRQNRQNWSTRACCPPGPKPSGTLCGRPESLQCRTAGLPAFVHTTHLVPSGGGPPSQDLSPHAVQRHTLSTGSRNRGGAVPGKRGAPAQMARACIPPPGGRSAGTTPPSPLRPLRPGPPESAWPPLPAACQP